MRKKTRVIKIGNLKIGGNNPVLVQSMTNTPTSNVKKIVKQIKQLEEAGCEIVRVGVPDLAAAKALGEIKKNINIPLVADIHFSADLALIALSQGVDKLRINPGNFPKQRLTEIVSLAKKRKVPIRVGVNSGSIEKDILKEKKKATPEMMVKSAIQSIRTLEKMKFYDIVVALKAPDVERTVRANRWLAQKTDYPIHLGVTEAGTEFTGNIKSASAFAILLSEGIGDTIRVSLSADPVREVKAGWEILKSLGLRERGARIISCPTCARSEIDVISLSKKIEELTAKINNPLQIAVMGCVVNGLGEAREADLGIVGVKKDALITKKGKTIKRAAKNKILSEFKKELKDWLS